MMKGDRLAKRSPFGSMVRKRLSDISNLHKQPRLLTLEDKALQCSPSSTHYVEQLLEENKALMELVEERNKVVASSSVEMQKLRTKYQKLQQQNWNLAQSNSHYLAELNLGREKLKALQHELVCKNALLKVKKTEGKVDMSREMSGSKVCKGGEEATEEPLLQTNVAEKHSNFSQRQISRSQSLGPTAGQQVAEKERVENKRLCLRRQSCSGKPKNHEASENLFEIEEAKFPISKHSDSPMHAPKRPSIGRPLRRASEKVQSYKEVAVNVKMRRPDWAS